MVQQGTLRKTCTCTFYEHACLETRSDNWKFNGRGMNFANCVGFQMRWNLREKTALLLAIFAFFIKFCNKRKHLLSEKLDCTYAAMLVTMPSLVRASSVSRDILARFEASPASASNFNLCSHWLRVDCQNLDDSMHRTIQFSRSSSVIVKEFFVLGLTDHLLSDCFALVVLRHWCVS